MEPIVTEALAVTTLFTTKKLENGGEKLGEAVIECSGKVLASLRNKSPETVTAIEIDPAKLDYAKTVEIIKNEADRDPKFAKLLQELVAAAQTDPNPKLSNFISQQPTVYNAQKLADNIKNVFQGNNTFNNNTFLLVSPAGNREKSLPIAKNKLITSAIGVILLSIFPGIFLMRFHPPRSEVQAY